MSTGVEPDADAVWRQRTADEDLLCSWGHGVVDWLWVQLRDEGRISPTDVELLYVTNDPDAVVDLVTRGHDAQLAALGLAEPDTCS